MLSLDIRAWVEMNVKKYSRYIAVMLISLALFVIFFLSWFFIFHTLYSFPFSPESIGWWILSTVIFYIIGFYFYAADTWKREKLSGYLLLGYSVYLVWVSLYTFMVEGVTAPAGATGWENIKSSGEHYFIALMDTLLLIYTPYLYLYLLFHKRRSDVRLNKLKYALYIISLIWLIILLVMW